MSNSFEIEIQRLRYVVNVADSATRFIEAQDEVSRCIESGVSEPYIERARERVNCAEKEMRNIVRLAKEFDRLNPSTVILEVACRPPHPGPAYSLVVNHTEAYANLKPNSIMRLRSAHKRKRARKDRVARAQRWASVSGGPLEHLLSVVGSPLTYAWAPDRSCLRAYWCGVMWK